MVVNRQSNAPADGDSLLPSATAKSVTVAGEITCLPHRDSSGPQTLECAFGLKTEDGVYYGLRDNSQQLMDLPAGQVVKVTGALATRTDSKYQDVGVITIEAVEKQ
jgi:hypothetical protein